MSLQLHIELRPGVVDPPEDVLEGFPMEEGQSIIGMAQGVIILDLGEAEDTTTEQEWYLNGNDDVFAFYVVE